MDAWEKQEGHRTDTLWEGGEGTGQLRVPSIPKEVSAVPKPCHCCPAPCCAGERGSAGWCCGHAPVSCHGRVLPAGSRAWGCPQKVFSDAGPWQKGDDGQHTVTVVGMSPDAWPCHAVPEAQPSLPSASCPAGLPGCREQRGGLYFPPWCSCLPRGVRNLPLLASTLTSLWAESGPVGSCPCGGSAARSGGPTPRRMKYWSCCGVRTTDFSAFLEQPGCSTGRHCWTGKAVRELSGR